MADPADEPISEPRAFAQLITEIESGLLHDDLSRQAQILAAKVHETGRAGELVLKIGLKPEGEAITVQAEIVVKPPKEKRRKSIFFTDDSGNLRRENPRQPSLPLRAVEPSTQPIKKVN